MERDMNANKLFKSCLLACSVLAGAEAVADPIFSSQGTVNSIEFSFMSYSSTPSAYFSSVTATNLDSPPSAPATAPAVPLIIPTEVYLPSTTNPPAGPQIIETSGPTQQSTAPAAAAVIPEPATAALFGLGLAFLLLRRREGLYD
jgi:hypothetical protein